ncbi:hypothetical protein TSOC_010045 [Tetrabaena socialis]|uniref:Glycosyltransferase family 92 protein n=1 Tax=Tetrabaena socialis TaxID=47790 RepID=A0A2J7ZUD5_9CHLO|nr:hypothetical protein TSOC_013262 [Tetrabaena socialis]PNH03858.1 hypothetical protein TSOC_010045 [Tetrabaena socialis]|eukprot:PNH00888.1 hypothetical protein TSOC_013262 [Tetrabaena socialis]
MNMLEWIQHYVWQGVDHFFLIDNDSTDDYKAHLAPYVERGQVTIIHLSEQHVQAAHYNHVLSAYGVRDITEWLIVCDLDEFYFATGRDGSQTVREYLQRVPENVSCIYSSMKMFGSRDEYEHPASVRRAFLYREGRLHSYGKAILRSRRIHKLSIHRHEFDGTEIIDDDDIHLNHYVIQSKEYFDKVKKTRGDADGHVRDDAYFIQHDLREVYDDALVRLLDQTDQSLMEAFEMRQSSSLITMMSILLPIVLVVTIFVVVIFRMTHRKD